MDKQVKKQALKTGTAADQKARMHNLELVLKAFRITYQAVQTHSHWIEKQCGVSAAQLWAIWELNRVPGTTVSDLADAMMIHRSTASNMLDKLQKKDLVRRERQDEDQRVVRLYLTDAGAKLLAVAPKPARGLVFEALHHLPDKVVENLSRDLTELVNVLELKNEVASAIPMSDVK